MIYRAASEIIKNTSVYYKIVLKLRRKDSIFVEVCEVLRYKSIVDLILYAKIATIIE